MPVKRENSLFVEQARKPVLENGARCEIDGTQTNFKPKPSASWLYTR
jgi:hypothetical protein